MNTRKKSKGKSKRNSQIKRKQKGSLKGGAYKIAIAVLCIRPNDDLINFYKTFDKSYTIFIFIDDISFKQSPVDGISFIQITDAETVNNGFWKGGVTPDEKETKIGGKATSWDKAVYYFCKKNTIFDYIWFIEDDVYIPSINTLPPIDLKYSDSDLITMRHLVNKDGKDTESWCCWHYMNGMIDPPWAHSYVWICRVSKALLTHINKYVENKKQLFYLELMFNTLAEHNKLKVSVAPELVDSTHFSNNSNYSNKTKVYHGIKNIKRQISLREKS